MAQNVRVIPCDVCEGTDDVNSFCVNCKQNYCDNCTSRPTLLDSLKEVTRFKLQNTVFDIATVPVSKAWIAIWEQTMLVDINGKILVQTKSRMCGKVDALSNGDALYTPSNNVISRIDQTGKVSDFIELSSYVNDIRTLNDDVFVATESNILKLDNNGRKINTLDYNGIALSSIQKGLVIVFDGKDKIMVIQASDCRVVYLYIDATTACESFSKAPAFTADQYDKIIRGNAYGTTIHVFQLEGDKVARLRDYNVNIRSIGIFAVHIDSTGNLWIGTHSGEVIVTKYCQSD